MRVHLESVLATRFCGGVVTRRHDKIEFSKSAPLEAGSGGYRGNESHVILLVIAKLRF